MVTLYVTPPRGSYLYWLLTRRQVHGGKRPKPRAREVRWTKPQLCAMLFMLCCVHCSYARPRLAASKLRWRLCLLPCWLLSARSRDFP